MRQGDYRILYEIRDQELLILVVRIGHGRKAGKDPQATQRQHVHPGHELSRGTGAVASDHGFRHAAGIVARRDTPMGLVC